MRPLLPVHIVAGGLAIILGGIALAVAKGGSIHRKSGVLFVYAMATMGSSAVLMALRSGAIGNVMAGLTAMYFAVTALTTVRPASAWSKRVEAICVRHVWRRGRFEPTAAFLATLRPVTGTA